LRIVTYRPQAVGVVEVNRKRRHVEIKRH
jgi:hypothetical protein